MFATLREQTIHTWRDFVEHEFVYKLGDGSLPRDAFLHYLKQDYVYLVHYARAWALAVTKSDRIDEMRTAAATVHALIDEEMQLHIKTCAEEGISEAELTATLEEPENLAYTRFVLDAGHKGDLLDLLTALAPCVFGYGEIGARLAHETNGPPVGHPYKDWIDTYAGGEYQSVCIGVGEMMESVAERLIGGNFEASPRWPDLRKTFETASQLESGFWSMGLRTA